MSISIHDQCRQIAEKARAAARDLAILSTDKKDAWLSAAAAELRANAPQILNANAQDRENAATFGLSAALVDRLTLSPARIDAMAEGMLAVRALPDPVGEVIRASRRPNGLDVAQTRVPLGVILFIYESRPNVTTDAAALSVKSGNAVILRGGKESLESNQAIARALESSLQKSGLNPACVQLVQVADRDAVGHLLGMGDQIDLAIPRGGESLIRRVAEQATMPVLKHYQGICHVYVDADVDDDMAVRIVLNAKAQRPGVCNAAETLLIHRDSALRVLPKIAHVLMDAGVALRGDAASRQIVPAISPASDADWDTEYLDLILAVGVVDSLDAAVSHIARHGSKHTDAIVTRDIASARRFVSEVDSACVVVNASTRFNDGGELGLGAEIGISTDKLHARGPVGLDGLTSLKWVVLGAGEVRA